MDKTIEFEGITFVVPSDTKKLPVEAAEGWEDGKPITFVRAVLGPEAWEKFKARRPTLEDFERLSEVLGKAYELESVGESAASQGSSENTSEPSRPTSSVSTPSTSPQS